MEQWKHLVAKEKDRGFLGCQWLYCGDSWVANNSFLTLFPGLPTVQFAIAPPVLRLELDCGEGLGMRLFSLLDLIDQTTCRFSLTPRLVVTYSASFPDCFGTRVEWVGQGIVLKCLWNSAWEAVVWGTTLPTSELVSVVLRMLELQPLFSLHTVNAQTILTISKISFWSLNWKERTGTLQNTDFQCALQGTIRGYKNSPSQILPQFFFTFLETLFSWNVQKFDLLQGIVSAHLSVHKQSCQNEQYLQFFFVRGMCWLVSAHPINCWNSRSSLV